VLKDPYNFDFLALHDEAVERDLERALLNHMKSFKYAHLSSLYRIGAASRGRSRELSYKVG